MRKVSGLYLLLIAGCTHPAPAPTAAVVPQSGPRYFSLPSTFKDSDVVCLDVNAPGTCVTVAELRSYLVSRRAE